MPFSFSFPPSLSLSLSNLNMLFFLFSCFSLVLLSNLPFFKTITSWTCNLEMGFFSFQCFFISPQKALVSSKPSDFGLCDLPDLPLECILEKLSPSGLTSMSGVCRSFRAMCTQDHLWERHLKQKWGKLLTADSVYAEWKAYIDRKKKQTVFDSANGKGYFGVFFTSLWWRKNVKLDSGSLCLPVDSIMAWYLSLETGKFAFPAQVYNRENGNVGFLLSCYDAKVSYDSNSDSFKARYSAQGRPTSEENIEWKRLRSPAFDTSPYDLHVSDCLHDLEPGDHIEIQWRRSKEFPYGGCCLIGHMCAIDDCSLCLCYRRLVVRSCWALGIMRWKQALLPVSSLWVVLEFKQYGRGSRWREVVIDRKEHREVGNQTDGFYAGIRKLYNAHDIFVWKGLWPAQPLE